MMRRLGIYLILLLFVLSMGSCRREDENISSLTSTDGSAADTSDPSAINGSESTETPTDSDTSQPTSSFPSKTEGLTTINTTAKPTTTKKAEYEMSLLQYHPGLPGFDAEYSIVVKRDGILAAGDFSLSVNDSRVKLKDNKVIVPYSVRNEGKNVVVTVKPKNGSSVSITIPSKKWEITFSDDFNGNNLDPNKWSVFEPYLTYGSNPVSYCDPNDCYEVSNGTLKLFIQKKDSVLNGKTYHYKDACISTENKFTQTLGCYVAAMKYQPWSGVCGGFWLLPVFGGKRQSVFFYKNNPDWGCGEVDIIEYASVFGKTYSVTEHFWNVNTGEHVKGEHFWAKPKVDVADGKFHAIGVAITEDASYYYCDGELVGVMEHVYKTTSASGQRRNPVKNFMLFSYRMGPDDDSNWVGRWNFKDSDFPLVYEVDWCRAYK